MIGQHRERERESERGGGGEEGEKGRRKILQDVSCQQVFWGPHKSCARKIVSRLPFDVSELTDCPS